MCFAHVKKAYDPVYRELLWEVLARVGVSEEIPSLIRQFHDGMRDRVRMDNGELSDWFRVSQRLR